MRGASHDRYSMTQQLQHFPDGASTTSSPGRSGVLNRNAPLAARGEGVSSVRAKNNKSVDDPAVEGRLVDMPRAVSMIGSV